MTNQTRSAVHDAATKELGSTIEGQSLAAPITLLDKLEEDGERLSGELYGHIATCTAEPPTRPHRRVRAHTEEGGVWPRSK